MKSTLMEPDVVTDLLKEIEDAVEPPCESKHRWVRDPLAGGAYTRPCSGRVVAREITCNGTQRNVCQYQIDQVRTAKQCRCGYRCKLGESLYDGHWSIRVI